MPKGVAIAIGIGVVAVIGAVLVIFDQPQSDGNHGRGPDSGEYEDNQGPDSGDDYEDTGGPLPGPDSNDEQGPDSGDEIDPNEPTSPDSGDEIDTSPTSPDSGDEIDLSQPTSPDSGDEITLNEDLKNRAKSSCNLIAAGSTCVEYIGSYWTTANAKLNCSDSSAFSANACPRPALGGCRVGAESSNEIVTWHYSYGGDPYTEVVQYAQGSCTAIGAWWVN